MLHILKTIFCFILSPFRAIFNCLCRKRFRKYLLPTKVCEDNKSQCCAKNVENSQSNFQNGNNSSDSHVVDFQFDSGETWNDNWDDTNTVKELSPAEKIEQYRSELCRQKSQPAASEIEPDINFFEDMEPEKITQAKFFVGGGLSDRKNRLSVSMNDHQIPQNNDPVSISKITFFTS